MNFSLAKLKPYLCGLALLCAISRANAQAANTPAELLYQTPAGVSFRVTADGLAAIRYQNRVVATGSWSCFNAEGWFKDGGSQAVKIVPGTEKSIVVVDAHHARVRQAQGDVVATADYLFAGEDLTISTRLENNNATAPLNITGLTPPIPAIGICCGGASRT